MSARGRLSVCPPSHHSSSPSSFTRFLLFRAFDPNLLRPCLHTLSISSHTPDQDPLIGFSSSLVPLFLCVGLFFPRDQKMKVTQRRRQCEGRFLTETAGSPLPLAMVGIRVRSRGVGGGGRARGEGVGCCGPDSADCRKLYPLISPATPRDKGLRERIG